MKNSLIPLAPYTERLPSSYSDERILARLSSDAQIYAIDTHSRQEIRVESNSVPGLLFQLTTDEWQEPIQEEQSEGTRNFKLIRHLIRETWQCTDCDTNSNEIRYLWTERRCPNCWSTHIEVIESFVEPDYPKQIENYGSLPLTVQASFSSIQTHGHIWGNNPEQDIKALITMMRSYQSGDYGGLGIPNFDNHCHLNVLLLFLESLVDTGRLNNYSDIEYFNYLLNLGNLAQSIFKLSGDPRAAENMLSYFSQASSHLDDPVTKSMGKHSYGIAALEVLDKYPEIVAERITRSKQLRDTAINHLREAHDIVHSFLNSDDMGDVEGQLNRIDFVLADLLRIHPENITEHEESLRILEELNDNGFNEVYVSAALAENVLDRPIADLKDESDVERAKSALGDISKSINTPGPQKFKNRIRWASKAGRFIWKCGDRDEAAHYLESAVTYALKDLLDQIDPIRATHDSESYFSSFNALATLYADRGWWEESLALLETYRGRAIQLASMGSEDRIRQGMKSADDRDESYFGMFGPHDSPNLIAANEMADQMISDKKLGPFSNDYELEGLIDRLWELYGQLDDEETVFITLAIEKEMFEGKVIIFAIIFGLPKDPPRRGDSIMWVLEEDVFNEMTSEKYLRPGSFREKRLKNLSKLIGKHIIEPISELLSYLESTRAIVVAPGSLSNIPFEAYEYIGDNLPLPSRFGSMPSLMFGKGKSANPSTRNQKILILGYDGPDLKQAEQEAHEIVEIFGDHATYLPGNQCTKKRVIEELNEEYEYIHCICHGTYDKDDPRNSGLFFTGNHTLDTFRVTAEDLRAFVRLKSFPTVTMSACSTALIADSLSNTWHGLPGSFLEIGARCVIGARWPVSDSVAREFMTRLYSKMTTHKEAPICCFHEVQEEIKKSNIIEEWACFGYLGLP